MWKKVAYNLTLARFATQLRARKNPDKQKDPTRHDFSYTPDTGPQNQDVRSFCLCGLLGSDKWL